MKPFSFLWITDPWWMLDHARDTTLRLAEEAEKLKFTNYWSDVRSIRYEDGHIRLTAQPLTFPGGAPTLGPEKTSLPHEFQSLHWRMDPPVDHSYLHPLQLLTLGLRSSDRRSRRSAIVNPPEVLFSMTEKSEPILIRGPKPGSTLMAPSVISSQWEVLHRFGTKERRTVTKPLHLCQSKGIQLLEWKTPTQVEQSRGLLEQLTENFRHPVLLQKFLPEIEKGELRLWFVDGRLLACARKFPLAGDFRVNTDRGSRIESATLSRAEKTAIRRISAHLKGARIRLAAIDMIGTFVTDFNFTSPGLLRQLEEVVHKNLARPIILALARTPAAK